MPSQTWHLSSNDFGALSSFFHFLTIQNKHDKIGAEYCFFFFFRSKGYCNQELCLWTSTRHFVQPKIVISALCASICVSSCLVIWHVKNRNMNDNLTKINVPKQTPYCAFLFKTKKSWWRDKRVACGSRATVCGLLQTMQV